MDSSIFLSLKMLVLLILLIESTHEENRKSKNGPTSLSRKIRNAVFPDGATQGIFLAISTPISLPGRLLSLSYNYEANYALPTNATQFTNPYGAKRASDGRARRSVDRRHAYLAIEKRLKSQGLNGRACVLRTICETAETSLQHNGLVGDLIHILFTVPKQYTNYYPQFENTEYESPSTSRNKKLNPSFSEAERQGSQGVDCRSAYPDCPVGIFDFVTTLDN